MAESGNPESPPHDNVADMEAYRRRRPIDHSGYLSSDTEKSEGLSDAEFAEKRLAMWTHASYARNRASRILDDFTQQEDPDDDTSALTPTAQRLAYLTSDEYIEQLDVTNGAQRYVFEKALLQANSELQRHALEAVYRVHLTSIAPIPHPNYFSRHLRSLVESILQDGDTPPDAS